MRRGLIWSCSVLLAACCGITNARAGEGDADPTQGFKFKPLMLDAKGGDGTVLGLDFEYKKSWQKIAPFDDTASADNRASDDRKSGLFKSVCGGYEEEQGKAIPTWVAFTDCAGDLSAKGTLAADADKNPNKLIDLNGSYSWMRISSDRASTRMWAAGGQLKFETDQRFDNKQLVYGLKGTFTHLAGCSVEPGQVSCIPKLNFLGLTVGLQRVDPSTDKAREALIGSEALKHYERGEVEAFYKYNLPDEWNYLSDLEFNYRYFQEFDAPVAIKQASLDRHQFGLVRLNFGFGGKGALQTTPKMFVQYSRGSLPFDTVSERVVKIGLTFNVF